MNKENTFTQIRTLFGIEEDCGFTEVEMQPFFSVVEQMPQLLYDYYTTLGKHQALNQTQDCLVTPKSNLTLFNNPDYFVFYAENQNCCLWAIWYMSVREVFFLNSRNQRLFVTLCTQ